MLWPCLLILWCWLALGLAGVAAVSRKSPVEAARRLWLKYFTYAAIVHAVLLAMAAGRPWPWPWLAGALVAAGAWEITRLHDLNPSRRRAALITGLAIYAAVAAGFLMFSFRISPAFQMAAFMVVCVFDGFSQLTGQLVGRRRLAPAISPAKTVEGAAGGLVMALVSGAWLGRRAGLPVGAALALAAGVALAALAGDLAASLYKRRQGAKDFSALIPAHGGVLDRFDSTMAAGAAVWLLAAALGDPGGLWRTLLFGLGFLGLLGASEALYQRGGVCGELTRKLSHCAVALAALAMPLAALRGWQVAALSAVFIVLCAGAQACGGFRSLHAIGRRRTLGVYALAVGITLCYWIALAHGRQGWFTLAVAVLAISDPLACLVGSRWPWGRYRVWGQGKSLMGSGAFLASAFAIALLTLWLGGYWHGVMMIGSALLIALVAAIAEGLTPFGLDNVTIPMTTLGVLFVIPV